MTVVCTMRHVDEVAATRQPCDELVEYVEDLCQRRTYLKGKFLGKGAHARVYLCTDVTDTDRKKYAMKVMLLETSSLDQDGRIFITKSRGKEVRLAQVLKEVEIHRLMNHTNVVRLESSFQVENKFYMVLEHCQMNTVAQMLRNHERLSEPDSRHLVKQLLDGLEHIHNHGIIHRDLKPANIYLTSTGVLKIGDFGLADRIDSGRRGICGTPNYISPEVLMEQGYTTAVDIWAVGCITYHMLCGKPPFEAENQAATYDLIRTHRYANIASTQAGPEARQLINWMLSFQPKERPTIKSIRDHVWMKKDGESQWLRAHKKRKQQETTSGNSQDDSTLQQDVEPVTPHISTNTSNSKTTSHSLWKSILDRARPQKKEKTPILTKEEKMELWKNRMCPDRRKTLRRAVQAVLRGTYVMSGLSEEPLDGPVLPAFIVKWIDYSNKCGFGYQLTDGSVGVLFNNSTQIHLDGAKMCVTCSNNDIRQAYPLHSTPKNVKKQLAVLYDFNEYMDTNLSRGVSQDSCATGTQLASLLRQWLRTEAAAIFEFDNGVLQINFFSDHCKFIFCQGANERQLTLVVIDEERSLKRYTITKKQPGCPRRAVALNMYKHLVYVNSIL